MTLVTQHISTLKPAAQKLACLYAYMGQHLNDDDKLQLAVHGACMMGELPLLTANLIEEGIVMHEPATHFGPERQLIRPRFYAETLLFAMESHPEWLDEFDSWPLTRNNDFNTLQAAFRRCYAGKAPAPMVLNANMPPYLIGTAHERRFEPLMTMIRDVDFPAFICACMRKWMKEDFTDPEEIVKRQLNMRRFDNSDSDIKEMRALFNYYTYVCQGTYTPPTSIRMMPSDYLLKGVHAMAQGKCDLACKVFSEAKWQTDGIAAFYWVIATWTSKNPDSKNRLASFVAEAKEKNLRRVGAAVLLADTLIHPLQRMDMDLLAHLLNPQTLAEREYILQQRLAMLLAANFTGMQITEENFDPQSAFLRHEAAQYITYHKFEKKRLDTAFGAKPVASFARAKEAWEMMLERLLTAEDKDITPIDEGEHRVMYIIMNDGESIELREQNRLKDGRWGSGKLLPWSRFISGTEPFMDRTDQAIVADVRFMQLSRLTVGVILPHLVGSDRVYTGEQTPFRRVIIEQQTPYVIIERGEEGFTLQSNVQFQDLLSQTSVYHRNDSMHYVYFPMTERQRSTLQELLSVSSLPIEAEEKLTKLLPLLARHTEVHSDLLPEEQTMTTDEVQSSILIRLTPDPTAQTLFDTFVLVRPLPGGSMTFPPTQGDRVIFDQSEQTGKRVRIERQMDAERHNLDILLDYCQLHDIVFTENLTAHLNTSSVLDLLAFASSHPDVCAIEWPEGERLRMHTAPKEGWDLSIHARSNWFAIEGQVRLSDNSILTAQQLLQALASSHGGYVQLNTGDYLWLSEKLRKQLDALESLTTNDGGHPVIPALQTSMLAQLVNGEIDIHHNDDLKDYKQRIEEAEKITPEPPSELQATLRPYQLQGFQWLMRLATWEAGACLADDMGLGKTVQTIAFLLSKSAEGPALVVAPASVVPNWKAELQRFSPSLNVYNINEYYDRTRVIEQASAGDVVISTYGLLVSVQDLMINHKWNVICLDEAHNIKNRGTKTSAVCMQLVARHRIILTGTPVQNHLGELWNLFQFINPGLLGTYEQFNQKYIIPIENMQDAERQAQLQTLVAPFLLRRTKKAVVQELPEKTEITLSVELTEDELAFYEVIRRQAEERFKEEGSQLSINALSELTRLRRTACSPQLTDSTWTAQSSKLATFMELTQNIVDGGHAVLVFSQFTSFLQLAAQELKAAHLPYLYLDGSVTMRQREQLVQDFQHGRCPIFLISLKAGGVGLNLTAANYVIHLDPWWNPAIEQQATDRAYRIGQTEAVTVYHLISHHTIEEKILRLHQSKRALSDNILQGADQNYRITAQDVLDMLSE